MWLCSLNIRQTAPQNTGRGQWACQALQKLSTAKEAATHGAVSQRRSWPWHVSGAVAGASLWKALEEEVKELQAFPLVAECGLSGWECIVLTTV